jgi:hypothetical protein
MMIWRRQTVLQFNTSRALKSKTTWRAISRRNTYRLDISVHRFPALKTLNEQSPPHRHRLAGLI